FADTVATHQQNGRGWLGMKFQTAPHETPSAIIIHVRMLDPDIARQQEAMGIVGVNLVHGAFYGHGEPEQLIASLLDNLNRQRIEVDMVKFAGPRFEGVDNRLMSLQLVQQHLSDAAMFTAEGEVVIPSEVLYKKPVLVERGSFRPITATTLDILERALEQFLREPQVNGEEPVILMEMTLHSVLEDATQGHKDFLDRVDLLRALGRTVVISDFGRYYRLVEYLSRYTQKMQGIAMGVPSLRGIFDEKFYADLPGGLLEGLGRLFKGATKLYVYPFRDPAAGPSGGIVTADSLEVAPHLRHLYAHLLQNNHIAAIENYRPEYLSLFPPLILSKIQSGDESWERDVPPRIVELVKRERMFGWREKPAAVSA
ncbi:MAG: TonB-dependent receptor, partial [Verrucomicrobia bacterium]|nr:TonB-dependent receptor [Verrucomicrobiota bacterium]